MRCCQWFLKEKVGKESLCSYWSELPVMGSAVAPGLGCQTRQASGGFGAAAYMYTECFQKQRCPVTEMRPDQARIGQNSFGSSVLQSSALGDEAAELP